MDNRELSIHVKLSSNDILKFQMHFLLRQWYSWVFSVLFLGAIGYIAYAAASGNLASVPAATWIVCIFFLFFILSMVMGSERAIKNKFVREEKVFKVSDEHVTMETETTHQVIRWQDFVKSIIAKEFVALFIGTNSAHVIPTIHLTAEEQRMLRGLVKAKIKNKSNALGMIVLMIVLFLVTVGVTQYFLRD